MEKTKKTDPVLFTLLDEFVSSKPTKSERRRMQIIERTIVSLAISGIDKLTHESLAEECGISRSLAYHYFPDRDALVLLTMRFIRARFQKLCVDAIERETESKNRLRAYVETACSWPEVSRYDARAWVLFYYHCAVMKKYRSLNTELVVQGHARITALLEKIAGPVFVATDFPLNAKLIQNLITGYFLSVITEDHTPEARAALLQATVSECMRLGGV